MGRKTETIPVAVLDKRGRSSIGSFKYNESHVISVDGHSAVSDDVRESGQLRQAQLLLPAHTKNNLITIAHSLASGISQEGLYAGEGEVINNCARFIHDLLGVEFDHSLLADTSNYNGWTVDRLHAKVKYLMKRRHHIYQKLAR